MPEGHTLHRLAAQMHRLFAGQQWRVSSPQGRFTAGAARLDGEVPERAEAWGKHLFLHVDGVIWQVHLGLYGAFSFRGDEQFAGPASIGAPRAAVEQLQPSYAEDGWIIPEPAAGAVRARVQSRHGWADLRGPATCAVITEDEYHTVIAKLGPDPLRQPEGTVDDCARGQFASNLARRRISIAAALMDQAVIAGVGNIYRAESLFVERIDPDTPAQQLRPRQIDSLWNTLTTQLRQGYEEGVIRTLRTAHSSAATGDDVHDYRAGHAAQQNQQLRRHSVYQHHNTACLRCGAAIAMRELQGRRLYWCPGCQDNSRSQA
ncbi:Fpg/Nei family DNA glycosylase [Nesterenkonia rhizosphaerae]